MFINERDRSKHSLFVLPLAVLASVHVSEVCVSSSDNPCTDETAATWRWNVNTVLLSGSPRICLHPSVQSPRSAVHTSSSSSVFPHVCFSKSKPAAEKPRGPSFLTLYSIGGNLVVVTGVELLFYLFNQFLCPLLSTTNQIGHQSVCRPFLQTLRACALFSGVHAAAKLLVHADGGLTPPVGESRAMKTAAGLLLALMVRVRGSVSQCSMWWSTDFPLIALPFL